MEKYGWGSATSPRHDGDADSHCGSPFPSPRHLDPPVDEETSVAVRGVLSGVVSTVGKSFEGGGGQKAIVEEIQALSQSMDKRIAECREKVAAELSVLQQIRETLLKFQT